MLNKRIILFSFFKKNRKLTVFTCFLMLVTSILTIMIPLSLGKLYQLIIGSHSLRGELLNFLPAFWRANLVNFLIFFIILIFLRGSFEFFARWLNGYLGEKFAKELREKLFALQLRVIAKKYDQKGVGKYLLRYSGDLASLQNFLTKGIISFVSDLLILITGVGAMFWLRSDFAWLVVFNLLVVMVILLFLNRRLYSTSEVRRNLKSGLLSYTNRRLLSVNTIKILNRATPEKKRFNKRSQKLFNEGVRYQAVFNLIYSVVPGWLYLIIAQTFFYIFFVQSNTHLNNDALIAKGGVVLSFVFLLISLQPVLRRLLRIGSIWKVGSLSFKKLLAVYNLDTDESPARQYNFIYKRGQLVLKNVNFAYTLNKWVIQNFSMQAEPGKITLVKGESGQGKTTLIKLIAALYLPQSGIILADDQNIAHLKLKSWRHQIVIASEDFPLLGKTVFEAISYSRKSSRKLRCRKELANLQSGIPDKQLLNLDQPIGELGNNLSTNEKKLLSLTRAFLTDKKFMLLENPFSGQHPTVQSNISLKLVELKKQDYTIIIFSADSPTQIEVDAVYSI